MKTACRKSTNRQTVGFDQEAVSPLNALVPKTGLLAGRTIHGGLIFAGVDGAPTEQGDLAAIKVAPRGGLQLRAQQRDGPSRRLRPVLCAVELQPHPARPDRLQPNDLAQSVGQHARRADHDAREPVPGWAAAANRQLAGLLTGTGGTVEFVDQNKGDPKVHQYSVDVQRELPGNMALTVGYMGATGRDLGFGGSNAVGININQIDPDVARRVFPGPNGTWDAAGAAASRCRIRSSASPARASSARATIPGGPAAAAVPAVRRRLRVRAHRGGQAAVSRRDLRARQARGGPVGRPLELHLEQHQGQPVWPGQHLPDPRPTFRRTTTISMPSTASATSTRRIASSWRRFSGSRTAAAAAPVADRSGWNASAVVELVSGAPLNAVSERRRVGREPRSFGGRQRPNCRRSEHRRAAIPTACRSRGRRRALFQRRRVRESRARARSATRRAPSATRVISSGRTSTSSSRRIRGSATRSRRCDSRSSI